MFSAQGQEVFFENLLEPLKLRYKTAWCSSYFYFVLVLTDNILEINAHFQQFFLRVLQAPYRWLSLLYYLDLTGGILSSTLCLSLLIAIPQLSTIMTLAITGVALSFSIGWLCQKLKLLAVAIEAKLQYFFGEDIDSTLQDDRAALHSFFQSYLLKLPEKETVLSPETAQKKYLYLKALSSQEIDMSVLPSHLQHFKHALKELWLETLRKNLHRLQSQTIKDLELPVIQTQEDFLRRYSNYTDYLREHQRLAVIAFVTEASENIPFLMLRDQLSAVFMLPTEQSDPSKYIAWQAALCELLRQECTYFFGKSCSESPGYRDTIWWLRDKMNGLETPAPEVSSCVYFKDYDMRQWDKLTVLLLPPIILSCSELINACPQNGALYAK